MMVSLSSIQMLIFTLSYSLLSISPCMHEAPNDKCKSSDSTHKLHSTYLPKNSCSWIILTNTLAPYSEQCSISIQPNKVHHLISKAKWGEFLQIHKLMIFCDILPPTQP